MSDSVTPFVYNAILDRVVDGDTIDVVLDLGFDVKLHKQRVRLAGIDTPESRTRNLEEKALGLKAKDRLIELKKACEWLGFERQEICDGGLSDLSPKARNEKAADWSQKVSLLTEIFKKWSPSAIFFPNSNDWNQTHLGVHLITLDSVTEMNEFFPFLIETEYWGQMPNPNLLAESSTKEVSDLIGALSHHKGELLRNPFHIRLPAWMQDNVRRGAEVVGGQGAEAPNFNFATLYRVNRWNGKRMVAAWEGGKMLPSKNSCDKLISEE